MDNDYHYSYTTEEWERWLNDTLAVTGSEMIRPYGLTIENTIFTEPFFYSGTVAFTFRNCLFEKKFTFNKYEPTANVYIYDCVFMEDISLLEIKSENKIIFSNALAEDSQIIIDKLTVPELTLNIHRAGHILFGSESKIDHTQIGGIQQNVISKLTIAPEIIQKELEINHAYIKNFYIGRSKLEKELTVTNTLLGTITLENFRNNGVVRFSNCMASPMLDTEMVINQCNLGKTEFIRFDFAGFKRINISFSILLDCLFINCKWSSKNIVSQASYFKKELETVNDQLRSTRADNLREVYKQIKQALSKQGDSIQERYFHGLEMNQYNKTLSFLRAPWTKTILILSAITSNYGQSIIRPLLWAFVANAFLMWIMNHLTFLPVGEINASNVTDYFAMLCRQINPLHNNTPELTGYRYLLDLLSRIISSYMIYNLIRASRRFVK